MFVAHLTLKDVKKKSIKNMIIFFTDPSFSILLFLFCRPTDPVFTTVSPVEQLIKLVSPKGEV